MNKKTFFIIAVVCLLGAIALWFFLRPKEPTAVIPTNTPETCLVFQSDDSQKPCFVKALPITQSTRQGTSTVVADMVCDQGSVFEKNDCVSKIAEENKDKSLCSSVEGALARAACLRGVGDSGASTVLTPPQNSYESYLKASVATAPAESVIKSVTSPGSAILASPFMGSSGATPESLYIRSATLAKLSLYTVFPYQSRPGDSVRVQGSGFALEATNVVYFGGVPASTVASVDGMTLQVVVPPSASYGAQEVWVTNPRGSSRLSDKPIQVVISQNPQPAPIITGFSPTNPSYKDTVTLSGENLSGIKGIYTSFGPVLGNSHSFRVSDLEYAHLVTDKPANKGLSVPLYVYVQTDAGLSEKPFVFNVQF